MAAETDRPNSSKPAVGERTGVQSGSGVDLAWHQDALAERLRRLDNGDEATSSWTEAKERIRAQIRAGKRGAASTIE